MQDALDLCERKDRVEEDNGPVLSRGAAPKKKKRRRAPSKASRVEIDDHGAARLAAASDSAETATGTQTTKKKKKKKKKKKSGSLLGIEDHFMKAILAAAEQQQQQLHDKRGSVGGGAKSKQSKSANQEGEPPTPKDPLLERQQMQENVEKCLRKTEILRGRLESLGLREQMIQQRILEEKKCKKDAGGVRAAIEQRLKTERKTKILNSKLERLHTRRNKVDTCNATLKSAINERRKERVAFEGIQHKLRADFEQKQREMADLLRSANEYISSRLRAEKELKRIELEDKTASENTKEEISRLETIIRKQESIQTEMQTASLKRRAHQIREQLGRGKLDPEEEARLKARLQSLTVKIEKKSHEIEVTQQNTILNFEDAFEKILSEVSLRSEAPVTLGEVVENYVNDYDEAFTLLSYIQGVQDENVQLETQIASLRDEMGRMASQQGKDDQNKERIRRELQRRLEHLRAQNLRLQDTIQEREKSREVAYATVERIMDRFNATLGNAVAVVEGGVTDDHVMQVLGQIELRTVELTQSLQQAVRQGAFRGLPARAQRSSTAGVSMPVLSRQATLKVARIRTGPPSPHRGMRALAPAVQPLSNAKIAEVFTFHTKQQQQQQQQQEEDDDDLIALYSQKSSVMHTFHDAEPAYPGSPGPGPKLGIQSVEELRRIIQQNFPLVNTTKLASPTARTSSIPTSP